jgi:hypothetical protein
MTAAQIAFLAACGIGGTAAGIWAELSGAWTPHTKKASVS